MLATPAGQTILTQCAQFLSRKEDVSPAWTINLSQHIQYGRFSTPRWSIDGKETLSRHLKRHIIQDDDFFRMCCNTTGKVLHLNKHIRCIRSFSIVFCKRRLHVYFSSSKCK